MEIEKVGSTDKVMVKETSKWGESAEKMKDSTEDRKGATPEWYCFAKALKEYPVAFGCCYVSYKTKDGRDSMKLPFVFWCTEGCKVNKKMIYSSTKIPTSRKIPSINLTIQCADSEDISFKEIVPKVSKGDNQKV